MKGVTREEKMAFLVSQKWEFLEKGTNPPTLWKDPRRFHWPAMGTDRAYAKARRRLNNLEQHALKKAGWWFEKGRWHHVGAFNIEYAQHRTEAVAEMETITGRKVGDKRTWSRAKKATA